MNREAMGKVLFVDGEESVRKLYTPVLREAGYEVEEAADAEQAMQQVRAQQFDLVLLDIHMPGMSGDELIGPLREIQPDLVVVIIASFGTMELAAEAVRQRVYEFLYKPFTSEELKDVVQRALKRPQEEVQRIQEEYGDSLLKMQTEQSEDFDLHRSVDAALDEEDSHQRFVLLLCEEVPRNSNILKMADEYRHFRAIFQAQKILNEQIEKSELKAEMQLVVAHRAADIAQYCRRYRRQLCAIVFGPNFPRLRDSMVRLMAGAAGKRYVVVCHHPETAQFTWESLLDFGRRMEVISCRSNVDEREMWLFWLEFFAQQLKPLIEEKMGESRRRDEGYRPPPIVRIKSALARDHIAVELLPGFPHICRQALEAIDRDKSHVDVAKIIRPDGPLSASIMRTANLARYGALQRIESLPNALTMIGMEETRKLLVSRAMSELMDQIDEAGFDPAAFFLHSTAVGYLAQILSLNLENPSAAEQAVIKGLGLPDPVTAVLRQLRWWERFKLRPGFDAFAAGTLHDMGKMLNTVCYPDVYPLILYEIERNAWKHSLLDCETAVVGDFQHSASGGALLQRWEIFPELVDSIHLHHHVGTGNSAEAALTALANCLVKGLYPFPHTIAINDDYRKIHLEPVADPRVLNNPLPGIYRALVKAFGRRRAQIPAVGEGEGMDKTAARALIDVAQETVSRDGKAYMSALLQQNPEFLNVARWTKSSAQELVALGLLLGDALAEKVEQLFQSNRPEG